MKRNRLIKRKKINFFPSNVIKNNKGNATQITERNIEKTTDNII